MGVQAFIANIVKNNMKKILAFVLCVFAFSCSLKNTIGKHHQNDSAETKASQDFVQGSEDIPLLEGMTKIFDEGLGFDSANGSIMSSTYKTNNSAESIKKFYQQTLPQMGWKISKGKNAEAQKVKFKRENEQLEIEFTTQNGKNLVKFFISSAL